MPDATTSKVYNPVSRATLVVAIEGTSPADVISASPIREPPQDKYTHVGQTVV